MPGARRRVPLVAALAALALLAGCSRAVMTSPPVPPVVGREEVGMASWYGAPHHGRRTASGEVYDMHQLTAAHKTLPFGTRVLVTNRDTSQAAEVRVNDRGPFVEGRILDVSYAAARRLGAVGPGIIPVSVRILSLPARSSSGDGPVHDPDRLLRDARSCRSPPRHGERRHHRGKHRGRRTRLPRPRRRLPQPRRGRRRGPRPHRTRLPGPRPRAVAARALGVGVPRTATVGAGSATAQRARDSACSG